MMRIRFAAGAVATTLAAAIVLTLVSINDVKSAPEPPASLVQKSTLLTTAPPLSFSTATGVFAPQRPDEARARASEVIQTEIPLPPGRNDAASIDWSTQGDVTEGDIRFLVQYKAACDWYIHSLDHALNDEQLVVVGQIPQWSAFRGSPFAQQLTEAAAAVQNGDRERVREHVSKRCRTSSR